MAPSIYINLEDDVPKVIARIKKEKSSSLVLVCPKRCYLFNDSINLRLLKKQTDLLQKEVFVLTMDERGQTYAKEAGFGLKFLTPARKAEGLSDIKTNVGPKNAAAAGKAALKTQKPLLPENTGQKKTADKPIPQVTVTEAVFPKEVEESYKLNKKKAFNLKILYSLLTVSLITIAVLVLLVLPKATVLVYPKSEAIARDIEVALATSNKQADVAKLLLPAQKIKDTVTVSSQFTSQGKKEIGTKASGLVRIYNFTKLPLNLKAATTNFTLGNKNYQLTKDAFGIRPTIYKNPKTKEVDPATLADTYEITAMEGGEDYNIPAGTRIEISNQIFGSKPLILYAKSETPISGGTSRFLSVVSDSDFASSRSQLGDMLLKQENSKLGAQNLALIDKAYVLDNIQFSSDKPVGTESPNFTATLTASISGLAFDQNAMQNLINERIRQTLPSSKFLDLSSSSPQTVYKLKTIDLNSETAVILVHFEGNAVYSVNLQGMASVLRGKTQTQVNEILRSRAEIDGIEITLAPSWQKTFPFLAKRIEINLQNPVNKPLSGE